MTAFPLLISNLTGGHNFHGRYEFIPVNALDIVTRLLIKIISLYVK